MPELAARAAVIQKSIMPNRVGGIRNMQVSPATSERWPIPGHDKQLSNHAATLPNVFLDQLTARDSDESAVCVMRHSSGQKGFACSRGTIKQHSLKEETQLLMRRILLEIGSIRDGECLEACSAEKVLTLCRHGKHVNI